MGIGDQEMPTLAKLARADAATLYGAGSDTGVLASYYPAGSISPASVRVSVAAMATEPRDARSGNPQTGQRYHVLALAAAPGEAAVNGVGSSGGIVAMRRGDRITVPGWAANRPGVSTVDIVLGDQIVLTEAAEWSAIGTG